LLVEKLIQGYEVGDHMVQQVILMAAAFQVPHAGLPDWSSDSRGKESHRCGDEVFFKDPTQITEGLPDSQRVGILMSKSRSGHPPWLNIRVAGASGNGKDHPTAESAKMLVLPAIVPWAFSDTKTFQRVDQKAGKTRLFLTNTMGPSFLGHLKVRIR